MDQEDMTQQIPAACSQPLFYNEDLTVMHPESAPQQLRSDLDIAEDGLSNGTCDAETMIALHCPGDSDDVTGDGDNLALGNDDMSEFSNSDLSLPEVCISTNFNSFEEEDMNHEVQQAYRIFTGFLLDKHKGITSPFLHPIGHQEAQHGIGGVRGRGQVQLRQSMCLRRMEEKFTNQEYETITEFVADFRLMLENCYRYHGVDHWISKQAQKLEIMLEQKLTLLSRTLREKTTLAVTSNGRFGTEEERGTAGTSTRRRLAPRSLTTITVGGHESIMVQTLRLEEQQRAKEEKRQRELEKKEAEEMSAKEVEEWEQTLLSQASPHTVDALWELPAIGHFLCLAQTALNLPEIVFFELERCLLMPRCSLLLSKIMSSLLSPPQRRATLHRRPALPYRRWESELRQRVMAWYRALGASHDQPCRAEQLGLCHQFFSILGEVSPLEEKPFHLLPFYQRVWLLKGLCDHVYETQKSVQDAVLSQPIHECRESILGYDSKENAYIHFPHFCGADLRIYCQSPSTPPAFPFPSIWVTRVEIEPGTEGNDFAGMKTGGNKREREYYGCFMDTEDSCDIRKGGALFKRENGDENDHQDKRFKLWSLKKEEGSESGSSDRDSYEDSKLDLKTHTNPSALSHTSPTARSGVKITYKEEMVESEHQSMKLKVKQEQGFSLSSERTIEADTQEPCLSVGEHSYTGRSPARSVNLSSAKPVVLKMEGESHSRGHQSTSCLEYSRNISNAESADGHECCSGTSGLVTQVSSESTQTSSEERVSDKLWTKKTKRKTKKKQGREQLQGVRGEHNQLQQVDKMRPSTAEAAKSAMLRAATTIKRKDKKRKHKTEKKFESSKKITEEPPTEPSFKLVCTSLEELRELISKTEDELDDLESSKKRPGRWYHRREAVKDLHSTLIRLLNELSPWEPKLVKAYQRNRLRLKKEFDDFKKHPEYSNFVREECISSSSSDEDEERGFGKVFSLTDHYKRSEEEDLENKVPRCLWSGASIRGLESAGEAATTCIPPIHLKHPLTSTEKGISVLPRAQPDNRNTSAANSGPQSRSELIQLNQSMESESSLASELPAQIPLTVRSTILHPTTGLPKGYTPIPTLLAKSVGNKVTLMKRPADCVGFSNVDRQSKGSLVPVPTSTMVTTKLSKAQSSPSSSQKNSKQMQLQGQQQNKVHRQSAMATVTAALLKSPQVKQTQTVPKIPAQVVCEVPEVVNPPARKDTSSPVKISVHPVLKHNTGDKGLQQVVILTSNILVHTTEEKMSSLHQQQSKDIQVPISKEDSPSYMSTSVPGFTIPENRIPVQQVSTLKDAKIVRTPSHFVSPCQQQGILKTAGIKGAQICSPQASTPQGIMPNLSPITSPTSAVSTEPIKSTGPKQELKTVCIRDSQSILVTTRGGNTGIVKVQTSSNSGALGSLSTSPIITISPQFKAFLISKTSTSFSTAPAQTSPCAIPAVTNVSMAQSPKPVLSVKSCSTLTPPMPNAVTGSVPISCPKSQTAGTIIASTQGSNSSACISVAKKTGQIVQTTTAASHFQASLGKNTVVVPSASCSGVPPVVTHSEFSKIGVKGVCTEESSQVTKFILVSPSVSPASSAALSKGTPSSTKSLPNSRVMFISQPTAISSTTLMGSIPKQVITTDSGGQLPTTSLSSQTLKVGLSPGHSIGSGNSEALSKIKNISLPSGVQVQLSGKTTTIGQMIGALSCSPSKSTSLSVSDAGCPAATTPGMFLVPCSNSVITSSAHLASNASPLQSTPSYTISQTIMSTSISTAETLSTENVIKKHLGICVNEANSSSPAQVTATVPNSPAQIFPSTIAHQQSFVNTGTTSSAPFTTSAAGSVHQRVVINTSTPLAAGTQIILNNTRLVVPPQGLGPGSHVLIISSPAPQQVPAASVINTGASVPPQLASHVTVSPQAPALPQSLVRLSGLPAVSSSVVSCAPAVGSSLVGITPNITTVQQTETPGRGATLLPRHRQAGHFASPPVETSRLGSVPGLLSPVVTSTHAFGSAPAPMRIAAGTPTRANGSSTILCAGAHPLPTLSIPPSPLPLLPSSSAVSLSAPVIPVPTPICSAAAPLVAGTHLHSSFTSQHMVSVTVPGHSVQRQQTAVTIAAPSTALAHALLHTGLGNTSIRKHVPPVMQPVFAGTRTQVLPTMSVPPIVSAVSRLQPLPVATVPPISSTANTFETAPVVTTPTSSSAVEITSAQSIKSLKTNNTIHPPPILTNQALGKQAWQTSAIGIHTNAASKLLISPDGAVLSTCQVNPAQLTACPKPLKALVVYPDSSSGVLHMHDSSLPPSQADTR